jgi:hypothetical protein
MSKAMLSIKLLNLLCFVALCFGSCLLFFRTLWYITKIMTRKQIQARMGLVNTF